MFPPAVPHVFIRWLTERGDAVYDPFCGRGTTVFEACALGRMGLGSDANPLAWVLSAAKADPPSPSAIDERLAHLRQVRRRGDVTAEPPEIRAVFDREVLDELIWLRTELSVASKVDRYLYAALLGILHANATADGTPRGLTIAMPNTFSMAPRYVMNYKAKHGLVPPKRNVIDFLRKRIRDLGDRPAGFHPGRAWRRDIVHPRTSLPSASPPKLIFTSPPYLGVMKYGKLNWLRLWLLGYEPKEVDAKLFASGSLSLYLSFMSRAIEKMDETLARDGRICLVIGDVRRETGDINLAEAVAESCVAHSGLRVDALVEDELPLRHKVSRIWKEKRGRATKTDRILILSKKRAAKLPRLPAFDWTAPV
jgi:site-specific DNA-methyltransferase (adenine-specific)